MTGMEGFTPRSAMDPDQGRVQRAREKARLSGRMGLLGSACSLVPSQLMDPATEPVVINEASVAVAIVSDRSPLTQARDAAARADLRGATLVVPPELNEAELTTMLVNALCVPVRASRLNVVVPVIAGQQAPGAADPQAPTASLLTRVRQVLSRYPVRDLNNIAAGRGGQGYTLPEKVTILHAGTAAGSERDRALVQVADDVVGPVDWERWAGVGRTVRTDLDAFFEGQLCLRRSDPWIRALLTALERDTGIAGERRVAEELTVQAILTGNLLREPSGLTAAEYRTRGPRDAESMRSLLELIQAPMPNERILELLAPLDDLRSLVQRRSWIDSDRRFRTALFDEFVAHFLNPVFPEAMSRVNAPLPDALADALAWAADEMALRYLRPFGLRNPQHAHVLDPMTGAGELLSRFYIPGAVSQQTAKTMWPRGDAHTISSGVMSRYLTNTRIEIAQEAQGWPTQPGWSPFADAELQLPLRVLADPLLLDLPALGQAPQRLYATTYPLQPTWFEQDEFDKATICHYPPHVIVCNPPRGQAAAGLPESRYAALDARLAAAYDAAGTPTPANMDTRILTWACEHIPDYGVIALVIDAALIEEPEYTGLRHRLIAQMDSIRVIDPRGGAGATAPYQDTVLLIAAHAGEPNDECTVLYHRGLPDPQNWEQGWQPIAPESGAAWSLPRPTVQHPAS
ncbi:hypothetical protein [Actinomyces ruminicola]|uniref:hypothetical protein n=1 Tax=Actinomyces ruminicola TaxID=332524 RepID=UPI0011CBD900|nr:hypothetical protein [Actinomyces ruminicola]